MSASKHSTSQSRRSPVGNRKSKTPGRAKSKPVSNGLHEYIPEPAQIGRSASTGKAEVAKMNLNTVRSLDSSVVSIKTTVPQVVIYQYDDSTATWERTSVEGTLFVCEREVSPRYGFVVLNKLHSESSLVVITPGMDFRVQELFVLYKNESGQQQESSIYGLCFQEAAVCKVTGDLLNRLSHSQEAVSNGRSPVAPRKAASAASISSSKPDQKVNVMEMIETASRNYLGQNFSDGASSPDSFTSEPIQFSTTGGTTVASCTAEQRSTQQHPTHQTTHSTPIAHPVKVPGVKVTSRTNPQKTPQSHRLDQSQSSQLHHAASFDNGIGFTPSSAQPLDHSRSFDHGSGIVRKLFAQNESDGSLLSQSLNNPGTSGSVPLRAVSLDEVEKQMTAEVSTPEALATFTFLNTKPSKTSSEPAVLLHPSMFVSTASSPIKAPSEPVLSQVQPSSISVQPPTPLTSQPHTLSGHSFPPIPPLMHSAGMKAAPKDTLQQATPPTNGQPLRASSEPTPHRRAPATVQPSLSPLPELTTSQPRSISPISSTLMSPHQFRGEPTESAKQQTSAINKSLLPLTREQMLQAFDYLLKNDEHFVDQLYNAYRQSLLSKQT